MTYSFPKKLVLLKTPAKKVTTCTLKTKKITAKKVHLKKSETASLFRTDNPNVVKFL